MEETGVLIARAQAGDKEARTELIEKNLGLVHHIVKRFLNRGYEAEDLFQIGSIGLIKAIDKFDLGFAVQFSTYAVPMIQGEIKRFLRDDGMVKVSRTLKENSYHVHVAARKLAQKYGREPVLSELAAETGLSTEEIVLSLEATTEVESIYRTVYESDGSEIYLVDQMENANNVGKSYGKETANAVNAGGAREDFEKEKILDKLLVKELLEKLALEERKLIRMRYFKNMTQVAVAKELGISQVQVSRMEKKILKHLQTLLS
ncbi:MAG: sigma-70 family RNA polymerase sigma factor [Lachnospiraceae bacterium]|nr:sigma-70 family RNA polymerase sigma factor [Lachnospiraceae bacterium]